MARRGFFAEIQHQSRVAAKRRVQAERENTRNHAVAVKHTIAAQKASERAKVQLAKAVDSEKKRLEKEAREAHVAAMEAEVVERNVELEQVYSELDSLLDSTLGVDDYVDLNSLRVSVDHPPFDRNDLEIPLPQPATLILPTEPVLILPKPPSGLASFFGRGKHSEAISNAQKAHQTALLKWQAHCRDEAARHKAEIEEREKKEERRVIDLRHERERYAKNCALRETKVIESNNNLDELIANLGYGTADAIQEYISIVLSNSVYPDHFQVTHEFEFDPVSAELRLRVLVPQPSDLPTIKGYKYQKTTDQIISTPLSQKECRDRYAEAIYQVALRTFHEVFESDRRGLVRTISQDVFTNTIDPATGNLASISFVLAAAERESFLSFDLSAVVPSLTLGKLGAVISKNPYQLVAVERAGGRRS